MTDEATTTTPAPATKPKTARKAKPKGKPAKATAKKPAANGAPRKGTKREKIVAMLTRASGCTAAELETAIGWPVSVTLHAQRNGIKLRKEKQKNGTLRYWGK